LKRKKLNFRFAAPFVPESEPRSYVFSDVQFKRLSPCRNHRSFSVKTANRTFESTCFFCETLKPPTIDEDVCRSGIAAEEGDVPIQSQRDAGRGPRPDRRHHDQKPPLRVRRRVAICLPSLVFVPETVPEVGDVEGRSRLDDGRRVIGGVLRLNRGGCQCPDPGPKTQH